MTLERLTLEQRIELIEKAVCTLIDSISPMNQEIMLTNRKIEKLEAICSELKNKDSEPAPESKKEKKIANITLIVR